MSGGRREHSGRSAHGRPIRIVDLFSGAGGFSLGWLRAHHRRPRELLAAIDADATLADIYATNFPGARFVQYAFGDPLEGDEAPHIAAKAGFGRGDVDVLLASPPCQAFSAAGKRLVHPDHRLVLHVCDVAEFARPSLVMIENVPEFSRAQDGRLIGRIRVRLASCGYRTVVVHLTATSAGVPQNRVRCFTIGWHRDISKTAEPEVAQWLQKLPNVVSGRDTTRGYGGSNVDRETTVAEAIGDLPSLEAGQGEPVSQLTGPPVCRYQELLRDPQHLLYNHVAARHSDAMIAAMSGLAPGETPQRLPDHHLRRKEYFRAAYARLSPDSAAPTMTTQTHNPGSGRFTHFRDNRVLTVREVARIQSFPDSFRFFGSQSVQRTHVGNAVPPLLSQAIAEVVLPLIDS